MCHLTCRPSCDLTSFFIHSASAVAFVGLIYCLILTFFIVVRLFPSYSMLPFSRFSEFLDDRLWCSRGIRHQQNAYLSLFGYRSSSNFYTWIPLPISFVISAPFFSDHKFMRYMRSFSTPCLTWPSSSIFGTSAPSC